MADSGSTILNLPSTAALNDTDVIPLARPSGTTAPGSNLGLGGAALKGIITAIAGRDTFSVLPYAASMAIDFNAASVQFLSATSNVTLGASQNASLLKTKELYLYNATNTAINFNYPTTWAFFPTPGPTSLAPYTQAILTLRALGNNDTDVRARFVVGPAGPLITNFSASSGSPSAGSPTITNFSASPQ